MDISAPKNVGGPAMMIHPSGYARPADPTWPIRLWLYVVAALVFAMVVVGGATRLTGSGLSITEWRPIMGIIPPLSAADWQDAFDKYRQIPEYKLVNRGMSLEAFKFIFWWEWGHRFLGRIVGVVFALPFLYFLIRGRLSRGLAWRLTALLALGGLQGFLGWYMVQSGLVDRVDVSQYRLALHLTLAIVILMLLLWTAWRLAPVEPTTDLVRPRALHHGLGWALMVLVVVQIALGALVAGMKAGLSHNTWPLMDGQLIPRGLGAMSPWYLNLFENALTVQFNHRVAGYLLVALALVNAVVMVRSVESVGVRRTAVLLAAAIAAQAALGVWTLLAHVPLALALMHQGFAAIIAGLAAWQIEALSRASRIDAAAR